MLKTSSTVLITADQVRSRLTTVLDPELHIDIVSLGLVYDVTVKEIQTEMGSKPFVHVLLTLTTPGCPLAGMFDGLIKESLRDLESQGLDLKQNVLTELTFDPPWVPDMMTPEARAELDV